MSGAHQLTAGGSLGLLIAVVLAQPACVPAGFLAGAVFPQKVPAAYRLQDQTTLILVDDPMHILDDPPFGHALAHQTQLALAQRRLVRRIVPVDELMQLEARSGSAYPQMPINQIAAAVGARQVIHVNIDRFVIGPAGIVATCTVRVIDATDGIQRFPRAQMTDPASSGQVNVQMAPPPSIEMTVPSRMLLDRELARRLGARIASLFADRPSGPSPPEPAT